MANETHIHLKGKGVRDFLENMALAWRAKYPQRAAEYLRVLKEDATARVNPTGMSRKGNFRYKGAIPEDIFNVLEKKYPYFFRSHENMKAFQEIFIGKYAPDNIIRS